MLKHREFAGGAHIEPLGDVLHLQHLITKSGSSGAELQFARPQPGGSGTTRHDLVR